MLNKKKILLFLMSVLMVGGTAALLHSNLQNIEDHPVLETSPWALLTGVVGMGDVSQGFPALGKVVSSTEVRIVPQISGRILQMGPREGGIVHKGDLLIHLDTRELEAGIGSLDAKLASSVAVEINNRKELQREKRLFEEGGSSASAVEQLQTKVQSDQANIRSLKKELESMQVKLSYAHITAPISGHVAKRMAEQGDTVFPGKVVYTLTAEQGGRVIVPVPLDTLTRIKPGGKVELSFGGQSMMVLMTRVNPSLDSLSMGSLEIDLPERPFHLPNGAPIEARVLTAEARGLSVPISALRPAGNNAQRTLFKVVDQPKPHVQLVAVDVQLCGKERCVIAADLQVGERVVTAHGRVLLQLHDGDLITPVQSTSVQP